MEFEGSLSIHKIIPPVPIQSRMNFVRAAMPLPEYLS